MRKRIEKVTQRPILPPAYGAKPRITYGVWSATSELKWIGKVLHQKFKRRVKRDWGGGLMSRSLEYDWKPVPVEAGK